MSDPQEGTSPLDFQRLPVSGMKFMNEILDRPMDEKPFLLLVVGYPSKGCEVPVIGKKPLAEIASFH